VSVPSPAIPTEPITECAASEVADYITGVLGLAEYLNGC
jgi:hypothetical protein